MDIFEIIQTVKFQEAIVVHGIMLYRGEDYPDWELIREPYYVSYGFYTHWDKSKNLLPVPSHEIKLYVEVTKEEKPDGWYITAVKKILKAELVDLNTDVAKEFTEVKKQ